MVLIQILRLSAEADGDQTTPAQAEEKSISWITDKCKGHGVCGALI